MARGLLCYLFLVAVGFGRLQVCAQPSPFTYQGRLLEEGAPANGNYDLAFRLFDAVTNGTPVSGSRTNFNVPVDNGLFTVVIDFGTPTIFTTNRWLDISVRSNGIGGAFTNLSPRQAINATPMALFALTTPPVTPATSGQNITTVFGSAALTVTSATAPTLIPGLSQTIDVPADSAVFISTDGGIQTTSSSTTGFSVVDTIIYVDGVQLADGGFRRNIVINNGGIVGCRTHWAMSLKLNLTAGSHTIALRAGGGGSGSNATVSGDSASVNQGQMTVLILKL